jgi:alpha/beta superfamily hydrolase
MTLVQSNRGKKMTSSPVTERPVKFPSRGQPSFILEGVAHLPETSEKAPVLVLCHPQPASSDMNDPLLVEIAQMLAESGMIALRFNFRGVGQSQGQQTDGRMEPLDVAGAIDCSLTLPGADPAKLGLIGHAFGAFMALTYAPFDPRVRTVVAISLPLYRATSNGFLKAFERPKLFVTGEFDEICPLYKLEPFVEQQVGPRGIKVITGARHLMRDYEDPGASTILKYLRNWATMPGV